MNRIPEQPEGEDRASVRTLPADAVFVCEYLLYVGIGHIDEAAYFRRADGTDELWLQNDFEIKRTTFGPTMGDAAVAARRLLDQSIRGSWGFQYPTGMVQPGLVTDEDLKGIVAAIAGEYERHAAAAEKVESRMVEVARELGLCPEPTGTGPVHWQARCPGTNHPLYIQAATESFGCGWCKRKGGEAELRAFVAERQR